MKYLLILLALIFVGCGDMPEVPDLEKEIETTLIELDCPVGTAIEFKDWRDTHEEFQKQDSDFTDFEEYMQIDYLTGTWEILNADDFVTSCGTFSELVIQNDYAPGKQEFTATISYLSQENPEEPITKQDCLFAQISDGYAATPPVPVGHTRFNLACGGGIGKFVFAYYWKSFE